MTTDSILHTFAGTQILRQTPDLLRSLLANVTGEDLDWRPSPDRWSISMVLAHLADVDRNSMISRFHAIAEQNNPLLPVYDQLQLFHSGKKFDGLQELASFGLERRKMLSWLETVPASIGSRTGRHEQLGVITFTELLNEFLFHDLGHIRQVIELYRSHAVYPKMGAFQNYYKIHP